MKKTLKIVILYCLFLNTFSLSAQTTVQEYIDIEKVRIQKADSIEVEINNFIDENLNSYNLSQTLIDQIMQSLSEDDHEGTNPIITETDIEQLLVGYKKAELRKLFFQQNPSKASFFMAIDPPTALQLACINGGFEQDANVNYSFSSTVALPSGGMPFGCNTLADGTNFSGIGVNNFAQSATRASAGNEPLLAALNPPILINRVNPIGGGSFSLKINPTPVNPPGNINNDGEIGNRTKVTSSIFTIDQNTIDFNFLLIGKIVSPDNHAQPTFRYVLADANTNAVLRDVCISMTDNDCRFARADDNRAGFNGRINYTPQWVCERINTANLINRQVRLIFQVSDCGRRGHFATVYIDNLCGVTCNPTWGTININPVNINCPSSPFQLCGNFQLPDVNTVIGNITLNVLNQSGNQVGATITNPVVTGQNYCFTVDPAIFGTNPPGSFTFQVNATLSNITGCLNPNILTNSGGNISFNNCCLPNLTLVSGFDDMNNNSANVISQRERANWIKASNLVSIGNNNLNDGVVYHAGDFVELTPGFISVNGSQFAAYIQGCTSPQSFVYKQPSSSSTDDVKEQQEINLVKVSREFIIHPNPSKNFIDLTIKNDAFNKITILSIDGKMVLDKSVDSTRSYNLDISRYASGVYIVNVISLDGKQYSQKLIKN